VQKATNKNTKTAAEGLLKQRLRTAGTPEFIGPAAERLTVDELGDLVLTNYRLNGKRSLGDVARHVAQLKATFGGERAVDLTADPNRGLR